MSDSDQQLEFPALLASAAHDMKNSLSILLSTLDEWQVNEPDMTDNQRHYHSLIRAESTRINNDLVYLLSLYKLENQQLQVHIDEVYVRDFLEEQASRHAVLLDAYSLDVEVDCDEDLLGYFDADLIAGVLNNAIVNAARYTKQKLILQAEDLNGVVCLRVIDDGDGFPDFMIQEVPSYARGINFHSGSTKLGLYFSARVAALHGTKQREGHIELSNRDEPKGGIFSLYLP